jgi:hypothetical protein
MTKASLSSLSHSPRGMMEKMVPTVFSPNNRFLNSGDIKVVPGGYLLDFPSSVYLRDLGLTV